MGIYSDNFYSWMDRQHALEKTVMDANPNGYKHPNGKPCMAKSIETCPFYKKDKSEAEDFDLLDSDTPSYDRKVAEIKALCDSGGLKSIPGFENATFDSLKNDFDAFLEDLEEYESGDSHVKLHDTQKRRNEIYQQNSSKEYATIDAITGQEKQDCQGFGVTFHTSLSDKELSDGEYDKKVSELCELGHVRNYNVGIFQGGGEISIDCESGPRALAMMLHWNQNSIFSYKSFKTIYNLTYDEKENPGLTRGTDYVA